MQHASRLAEGVAGYVELMTDLGLTNKNNRNDVRNRLIVQ